LNADGKQEFYAALFPAWEFTNAASGTEETSVMQFTFQQPAGKNYAVT
jgi:hypothetical protein